MILAGDRQGQLGLHRLQWAQQARRRQHEQGEGGEADDQAGHGRGWEDYTGGVPRIVQTNEIRKYGAFYLAIITWRAW